MRHRKNTCKFNRTASHRKAMFRNQVISFLRAEKITTTLAKAKATKRLAERLITLGKRGDLHSRRLAFNVIRDNALTKKLFDEIAPRFASVSGGYTRIFQLGPRKGDAADMALLQLSILKEKEEKEEEKKKGKKKAAPAKEKKTGKEKEAKKDAGKEKKKAAAKEKVKTEKKETKKTAKAPGAKAAKGASEAKGKTKSTKTAKPKASAKEKKES